MKKVTWLGVLNFVVLQWFGVRLVRVIDVIKVDLVDLDGADETEGGWRLCRVADGDGNEYTRQVGWEVWLWVVPLTGWWSTYRYMRPRYWRWLQLIINVHRIHHIRFGFGYTFRPLPWAYFPPWAVRGSDKVMCYGWQRVKPSQFHDCTWTGRY